MLQFIAGVVVTVALEVVKPGTIPAVAGAVRAVVSRVSTFVRRK